MPDFELNDSLPEGVRTENSCPPLALLRAWKEEALPIELARDVAAHAEECTLCRMLLTDLEELPPPVMAAYERERIRRKLRLIQPTEKKRVGWNWYAAAGAVAALVLAGVFLTVRDMRHAGSVASSTGGSRPAQTTTPASTASVPAEAKDTEAKAPDIQIAKLDPPVDLEPGMVLRGDASLSQPTAEQLAPAFSAYRSSDYTQAKTLFSQLTKQYPRSGTPFLYLGVTQLLTGENDDALYNLTRAEKFVGPEQKDAAIWYHLAAAARIQAPDVADLAHALCNRTRSPYFAQACQLEQALSRH